MIVSGHLKSRSRRLSVFSAYALMPPLAPLRTPARYPEPSFASPPHRGREVFDERPFALLKGKMDERENRMKVVSWDWDVRYTPEVDARMHIWVK